MLSKLRISLRRGRQDRKELKELRELLKQSHIEHVGRIVPKFTDAEIGELNALFRSELFEKLMRSVDYFQPSLGKVGMTQEQKSEAFSLLNGFSIAKNAFKVLMSQSVVSNNLQREGEFESEYEEELYKQD